MIRLSSLIALVLCLLLFLPESSIAVPKPKIRVNVRTDGSVSIRMRPGRIKRNRKKHILFLQRSGEDNYLDFIASFSAPKRRTRFIDYGAEAGFVSYQAMLVSKSGKTKRSNLSTVYIKADSNPEKEIEKNGSPPPYPTGPAKLSAGNSYCTDQKVQDMVEAINDLRAENGLGSLALDGALHYAAQFHSNVMADNQDLSHDNWSFEIRDAGFLGPRIGQNIAKYITLPASIIAAYSRSSQGHLENMLKENDTSLGVGCVIDSNGIYWWTHNFGRLN